MQQKAKPLKFHRALEASAFYGVSDAAVRKWKRMGRAARDPFPKENPVEVLRWYARHFRKSVPSKLMAAAQRWSGKEFPLM
ncbi:MAG: hypothetical protein JWM59_5085 [Verrucomicrobiales bacterium]|nr:hypothetical protein [Verrucomicrobiales bacterium]